MTLTTKKEPTAIEKLAEFAATAPGVNKASRGPRNVPKPDARKQRRRTVRAARRTNR